jgi:signal transduction histidine kinase
MRFALMYAGLFSASTLILACSLWWSTAGMMTRHIDSAIDADFQLFRQHFMDGGIPAVMETIQDRLDRDVEDNAVYLLTDPGMNPIAGNLAHWPADAPEEGATGPVRTNKPGAPMGRVEHLLLPDGFHLLVGRDIHKRDEIVNMLTDALLWEAGVMVVLGLAGAITVRSVFQMTLSEVSAITAAIGAGDLSRRMRVTNRGDEFDTLAETINDMLDRIALLMEGVRHVSNAIAHDLRTPITRARARLEYAARPGAGEAELRAAIERGQADLDGVVRVFQALLRIAEIESGSRRSAFAAFDLAPVLEDLGDTYGVVAEASEQRLECDIPRRLPAFGDREMIQQAVANLLDNALKFSPPGSTIRLSAHADEHGPCLVVADQGPGMSAADREQAGRRFFRAENARSTPGSGLGLAIVQAVAMLHGGSFRLENNEPGLRAILCLLPVSAAQGETGLPTAEQVEQHSRAPQQRTKQPAL